jgi:hypothetical protein
VASFVVAALLALMRLRVAPASGGAFWLAVVLTQLVAAAIGWGRAGRLFALTELATAARGPTAVP